MHPLIGRRDGRQLSTLCVTAMLVCRVSQRLAKAAKALTGTARSLQEQESRQQAGKRGRFAQAVLALRVCARYASFAKVACRVVGTALPLQVLQAPH